MDVAYNQHASTARRKNRSTTNLNHLTLAPLTTKLPLRDHDDLPDALSAPPQHTTSYLQGKSAPTTPRLLSRSPGGSRSKSHMRGASTPAATAALPKSKSTTQLGSSSRGRRHTSSGAATPRARRRREREREREREDAQLSARDRTDSDWLLRAGALLSSEARESKGQAWLASRASSTSLTGTRDADEDAFERELARERELASRHASRRGSSAAVDDLLLLPSSSPAGSRFGSRSHSRVGSRGQMAATPAERRSVDGYFAAGADDDGIPGPDFVNLDEKLEAIEQDTTQEDEAHVRRLVKRGNSGVGSWFGDVLGWTLFSVEETENEEDLSDGDGDGDGNASDGDVDDADLVERRNSSGTRQFEGVMPLSEDRVPPPRADEGGWQDAAWLLSVASKVLL